MQRDLLAALAVAAGLTVLAGCSAPYTGPAPTTLQAQELAKAPRILVATPPPPSPPDSQRQGSPGSGYFWRPGHYVFKGARYTWVPGAWVVPPRSDLTWVPGFWTRTPEGGVWIVGHWRSADDD